MKSDVISLRQRGAIIRVNRNEKIHGTIDDVSPMRFRQYTKKTRSWRFNFVVRKFSDTLKLFPDAASTSNLLVIDHSGHPSALLLVMPVNVGALQKGLNNGAMKCA